MNVQEILLNADSICVIRTDKIGDMILTLPMCQILKNKFPEKKITLITRSYTAPLLKDCPAFDDVLFIDKFNNGIKEIFNNHKFDVAFFPRPKLDEALAAKITGINLRCGSGYRWYSFLFNYKIYEHRKNALFHEAEYNVHMISLITNEDYDIKLVRPTITRESSDKVQELFRLNNFNINEQFIIIHPGSGGSSFTWSPANFGIAAGLIAKNYDLKIIVTGIDKESGICSIVNEYCPECLNLCGKVELDDMIALISKATLLISNSTGVLHIAAALDIPVVGLYPNSPHISARRWGPYSKLSLTISPPDKSDNTNKDNMSMICVETVVEAVGLLLGRK